MTNSESDIDVGDYLGNTEEVNASQDNTNGAIAQAEMSQHTESQEISMEIEEKPEEAEINDEIVENKSEAAGLVEKSEDSEVFTKKK